MFFEMSNSHTVMKSELIINWYNLYHRLRACLLMQMTVQFRWPPILGLSHPLSLHCPLRSPICLYTFVIKRSSSNLLGNVKISRSSVTWLQIMSSRSPVLSHYKWPYWNYCVKINMVYLGNFEISPSSILDWS